MAVVFMVMILNNSSSTKGSAIKEFSLVEDNPVYGYFFTNGSFGKFSNNNFDEATFNLKARQDAAILKYPNNTYPGVKKLLSTDRTFDSAGFIFPEFSYLEIDNRIKISETTTKTIKCQSQSVDFENASIIFFISIFLFRGVRQILHKAHENGLFNIIISPNVNCFEWTFPPRFTCKGVQSGLPELCWHFFINATSFLSEIKEIKYPEIQQNNVFIKN
jgi:hypothetical protein